MNKYMTLIFMVTLWGCNDEVARRSVAGDIAPIEETDYSVATTIESPQEEGQVFNARVKEQLLNPFQATDGAGSSSSEIKQHIIKTVHLGLEVEQLDSVEQYVQQLIPLHKGYIARSSRYQHNRGVEITMTIRVPAKVLDEVVLNLENQAVQVSNKETVTQDVGEEFVDLQSRLQNKRAAEIRYREILRQAKSVEDILKVENQLRIIREEIEAKQGRLRYLQNQVSYSTINLRCNQPDYLPSTTGPSYGTRIKKALSGGWEITESASIGIVMLWPLWLLVIGIWLLFRYRSKVRQKTM